MIGFNDIDVSTDNAAQGWPSWKVGVLQRLKEYKRMLTLLGCFAVGKHSIRSQQLVKQEYDYSWDSKPLDWNCLTQHTTYVRNGKRAWPAGAGPSFRVG